uniref:Enhancer of polycomb-like protein n=1 Tax=Fagus sylvatica TaxID=28930 RepID=A0A2N9J079_FAGSY
MKVNISDLIFCEADPDHLLHHQICTPYPNGGLAIRYLRRFNKALFGKWSWRFAVEREAFGRPVVLEKYGSLEDALVADYIHFRGDFVHWEVNFTRLAQDWELESVSPFLDLLFSIPIMRIGEDKVCWKPSQVKGFQVHQIPTKKVAAEIPTPQYVVVDTYERDYSRTFSQPTSYLRGRGARAELGEFIEYDLDNEDDDWLQEFNNERKTLPPEK